jgi:hypothetical protein
MFKIILTKKNGKVSLFVKDNLIRYKKVAELPLHTPPSAA